METSILVSLTALAVLALGMSLLWVWQRRQGDAGWVDLVWCGSIGVLGLAQAGAGEGWIGRRVLVAVLVLIWSLRLSWHLGVRLRQGPEDGRYRALREEWGESFQSKLFWFYQAQGVLSVLLALPFGLLSAAPETGWRVWDLLALLVFLVSIVGESVSDAQLAAWRSSPENRGRTCRTGLWAWSRHPNYFFEWMHWLAYPLIGVGLAWGWTLWFVPALMLVLVLFVTGIPLTEEQALRSRGEDYRAYQRETNAFFPGPPRRRARLTQPS